MKQSVKKITSLKQTGASISFPINTIPSVNIMNITNFGKIINVFLNIHNIFKNISIYFATVNTDLSYRLHE